MIRKWNAILLYVQIKHALNFMLNESAFIVSQTNVKPTTIVSIITAAMAVMLIVGSAQYFSQNHSPLTQEPNCNDGCDKNYQKYFNHMKNNYPTCININSALCSNKVILPT